MERDTVLLSINQYNALRDFKKKIEDGNTFTVITSRIPGYGHGIDIDSRVTTFYTKDDVIQTYAETNADLARVNEELVAENEKLRYKIKEFGITESKEITINDIKKMSYWEFRKWRKSK
jgi:aromatic ring-opening dioxygenase LigB subunit